MQMSLKTILKLFLIITMTCPQFVHADMVLPYQRLNSEPKVQFPWQKVPMDTEGSEDFCENNKVEFQVLINKHMTGVNALGKDTTTVLKLQRELLKLMAAEEIGYTTRINPHFIYFEQMWTYFLNRWNDRIAKNKAIFELDRSPNLGDDTCALSKMLGVACGADSIKNLDSYKQQALENHRNRKASRKIPAGMIYDLILANLIAKSLRTPTDPLIDKVNLKDSIEDQLKEVDAERRVSKDTVMGYWPELRTQNNLRKFVRAIMQGRKLEEHAIDAIAKKEIQGKEVIGEPTAGAAAQFNERNQIAINILNEEFRARPLKYELWERAEFFFMQSHMALLKNMNDFLSKGLKDPDWLLEQDAILSILMEQSTILQDMETAAKMQTQICSNKFNRDSRNHFQTIGITIASIIALLTGVGAMIGIGGATVAAILGHATLGLVLTTSTYQLVDLHLTEQEKIRQFALHLAKDSEVASAYNEKIAAVPMYVANVALIVPLGVVKKALDLQKIAQAMQNAKKVKQMDTVVKYSMATAHYGNALVAAVMVKDGVHETKSLLESDDEKQKRRDNAKLRNERRNKIRNQRTGEN